MVPSRKTLTTETRASRILWTWWAVFPVEEPARKEPATNVRTPTESGVSYTQDVLAVCLKDDSDMSESDNVAHVLKGIAGDAFNWLVGKNCETVQDIMNSVSGFGRPRAAAVQAVGTSAERGCDVAL